LVDASTHWLISASKSDHVSAEWAMSIRLLTSGQGDFTVGNLLISAGAFILLHRVISGSPLRKLIVDRLGEPVYGRLFQLATVAALMWLGVAYARATGPGAVEAIWVAAPLTRYAQIVVQPLALFLIVTGFTTPNPATFRQEAVAERPDAVQGILRVTRHPFLWGIAVFAGGHLAAAPTARNVVLFGTLIFVSLTGTLSIDAKRRRSLGSK
jgi:uncharacterized membrane protein